MNNLREPVLSGTWYPDDPATLAAEVDRYLALANPADRPAGRPLLLVVPHAGYTYSGPTAGKGYGLLRDERPERVIILAPNHRTPLVRCALTGCEAFATPLGQVPVDTRLSTQLATQPGFIRAESAHLVEHAVEIQLPFLQRLWPQNPPTILPILVPRLDEVVRHEAAQALCELWDDKTLMIISSDFTHYGAAYDYVPFATDIPQAIEKLDSGAILKILAADAQGLLDYGQQTGITMCGLEAAALALACGLPPGYEAALLDYQRSADASEDYSLSVSYAAILAGAGPRKAGHD